jgi:CHAT domain-containing protein
MTVHRVKVACVVCVLALVATAASAVAQPRPMSDALRRQLEEAALRGQEAARRAQPTARPTGPATVELAARLEEWGAQIVRFELREGVRAFDEALAIRTQLQGAEHPEIAKTLNYKARACATANANACVVDAAGKALTIVEKQKPQDPSAIRSAVGLLARAHFSGGDSEAALPYYKRLWSQGLKADLAAAAGRDLADKAGFVALECGDYAFAADVFEAVLATDWSRSDAAKLNWLRDIPVGATVGTESASAAFALRRQLEERQMRMSTGALGRLADRQVARSDRFATRNIPGPDGWPVPAVAGSPRDVAAGNASMLDVRQRDATLSRALVERDDATVSRLIADALQSRLDLSPEHPAGPYLTADLGPQTTPLLAGRAGDESARFLLNNLGVALALRGWTKSAFRVFERAVASSDPWLNVVDRDAGGNTLLLGREGVTPQGLSPLALNLRNSQRLDPDNRLPISYGALDDYVPASEPVTRLQRMAELLRPFASARLSTAARSGDLTEAYSQVARYKGRLMRDLRAQTGLASVPATVGRVLAGGKAPSIGPDGAPRLSPEQMAQLEAAFGGIVGHIESGIERRPRREPAISTLLRADEALVDIYLLEFAEPGDAVHRQYLAFVSLPSVPVRRVALGEEAELNALIDDWRASVVGDDPQADVAAFDAMSKILWTRLRAALPPSVRRLWIAPDERLNHAPWLAMSVADPSENVAVAIIDSVAGLRELRARSAVPSPSNRILLAGGVTYGPGFAALPATANEVRDIQALARARGMTPVVLAGSELTEPALQEAMPARIVHLATHGVFRAAPFKTVLPSVGAWVVFVPANRDSAAPLKTGTATLLPSESNHGRLAQSAFVLSNATRPAEAFADEAKTFLTDLDLAKFDLSSTEMVVLSACSLGSVEQRGFQTLPSMQTAILLARARSVVAPLWQVPDRETASLMTTFYQRVLSGESRVDALRSAMRSVRMDGAGRLQSPRLWAAWTLFGEGW